MASSRVMNVSDEDLSQFLEENENKNTARKTSQDVACNNLYFPFGNSYTSFTNNNLYSFVGKLTLNLQGKLGIRGFNILNKF